MRALCSGCIRMNIYVYFKMSSFFHIHFSICRFVILFTIILKENNNLWMSLLLFYFFKTLLYFSIYVFLFINIKIQNPHALHVGIYLPLFNSYSFIRNFFLSENPILTVTFDNNSLLSRTFIVLVAYENMSQVVK